MTSSVGIGKRRSSSVCLHLQDVNFKQRILRKIVAPLLVKLRIHRLLRGGNTRNAILMFHGVTARPGKTVRHMNTADFITLLKFIQSEFEVVPLDQVLNPAPGSYKRPRVALTFDDGYLNNFTEACPVLAEMQLPATFFLITDSLTDDRFSLPIDVIDCIIEKFSPAEIVLDEIPFSRNGDAYLNSNGVSIIDFIIEHSHRMSDFLAQLNAHFPFDFMSDPYYSTRVRFIDRSTLSAIARNPLFTFGSHTKTHINCARFNEDALAEQLSGSKKLIEEITGTACSGIAYPYGLYNETARKLTEQSGYTYALAVKFQLEQDRTDATIMPRIGISNSTTPEVNLLNISKLLRERGT